jgi:hypothetical protein
MFILNYYLKVYFCIVEHYTSKHQFKESDIKDSALSLTFTLFLIHLIGIEVLFTLFKNVDLLPFVTRNGRIGAATIVLPLALIIWILIKYKSNYISNYLRNLELQDVPNLKKKIWISIILGIIFPIAASTFKKVFFLGGF